MVDVFRALDDTSTDNSLAESFNATLKREVLQDVNSWPDQATCRRLVFRWLARYNTSRRHSWCRYLSPVDYETGYPGYAPVSGVIHHRVHEPGVRPELAQELAQRGRRVRLREQPRHRPQRITSGSLIQSAPAIPAMIERVGRIQDFDNPDSSCTEGTPTI